MEEINALNDKVHRVTKALEVIQTKVAAQEDEVLYASAQQTQPPRMHYSATAYKHLSTHTVGIYTRLAVSQREGSTTASDRSN